MAGSSEISDILGLWELRACFICRQLGKCPHRELNQAVAELIGLRVRMLRLRRGAATARMLERRAELPEVFVPAKEGE